MLTDDFADKYLARLPLDGPFTTAMARDEGVPAHALQHLVGVGRLRRPVRSVHVANELADTLDLRLAMLGLIVPDGCFVTDHTAAWLHKGDSVLLPNAHLLTPKPDIFRHSQLRALRNPLVRSGERRVRPDDLMGLGSIHATTPLRTACDLGRLFHRDVALWGLDSMLSTGAFGLDELLAELPAFGRQRGVVQLRVLAPLANAGSASFGESGLRLRWHDAALPWPQCQVPVYSGGRIVYWLDIGVEEWGFAAEYDGAEWHGIEAKEHDDGRRLWLDEERDWAIEVFRRPDVFGQGQQADLRLRRAFESVTLRRRASGWLD